jgi:hypothetical protein
MLIQAIDGWNWTRTPCLFWLGTVTAVHILTGRFTVCAHRNDSERTVLILIPTREATGEGKRQPRDTSAISPGSKPGVAKMSRNPSKLQIGKN